MAQDSERVDCDLWPCAGSFGCGGGARGSGAKLSIIELSSLAGNADPAKDLGNRFYSP